MMYKVFQGLGLEQEQPHGTLGHSPVPQLLPGVWGGGVPCWAVFQEHLCPSLREKCRVLSSPPHSLTALHVMSACPLLRPFVYPGSSLPLLCFYLTSEVTEAQGRQATFLAAELHFRTRCLRPPCVMMGACDLLALLLSPSWAWSLRKSRAGNSARMSGEF